MLNTHLFLFAVPQQEQAGLASSGQLPTDGGGRGRVHHHHQHHPRPFEGDSFCRTQASFWQEAEVPANLCCPLDSRHRPGELPRAPRPPGPGRALRVRVRVRVRGPRGGRARCPQRVASRPAGCRGGVSAARHRRPR